MITSQRKSPTGGAAYGTPTYSSTYWVMPAKETVEVKVFP